jgi:hypothetical protein
VKHKAGYRCPVLRAGRSLSDRAQFASGECGRRPPGVGNDQLQGGHPLQLPRDAGQGRLCGEVRIPAGKPIHKPETPESLQGWLIGGTGNIRIPATSWRVCHSLVEWGRVLGSSPCRSSFSLKVLGRHIHKHQCPPFLPEAGLPLRYRWQQVARSESLHP